MVVAVVFHEERVKAAEEEAELVDEREGAVAEVVAAGALLL